MAERIPIACDMSDAPDTPEERIAEYKRLFAESFSGRDRTAEGIRFRLRATPGVLEHLQDLSVREKACCPFFDFVVSSNGDEVWWEVSVVDDDAARQILEQFYELPVTTPAVP